MLRLISPAFATLVLLIVGSGAALAAGSANDSLTFAERLAATLESSLASGTLWVAFGAVWVSGLLTATTPCVYPLIPITVRYFGAMKANRRRVISLALMYVAGMVALYASLGTAFAALGIGFGTYLASPWVTGAIALFCVLMGVSMLGAFSLQLPAAWNTRLSQVGGQSMAGAFAMGLVSGLIAAPCTGPVIVVILMLIASTGKLLLGFGLMTAFGLGLGVPFLLLAIFSGALAQIPSSGTWMEAVKAVLATAMFVVAAYFVSIAWPDFNDLLVAVPAALWIGLGLTAAGVAIAVAAVRSGEKLLAKVAKASGVLALSGGVSLLFFGDYQLDGEGELPELVWVTSHDVGIDRAVAEGRPIMIDFTADWCQACKELDRETYVDLRVRARLSHFVNVKIDSTEITEDIEKLFKRYSVLGLPTVVFVDCQGNILEKPRVVSFVPPERFLALMQEIPVEACAGVKAPPAGNPG